LRNGLAPPGDEERMSTIACRELVTLVTEHLEDRLTPDDRARFDAHLAGCPHCTAYVAQMRETIRLTGTLREEELPPEVRAALLAALRDWKR
jgi:anti-sigma factor RsiW